MLGSGMIVPATPVALADAMTVLRVIADPKAAKANLDALAEAAAAIEAKMAELNGRETALAEQQKANETAADQLEKNRGVLDASVRAHAINQKALADARAVLASAKAEHGDRVAELDAQAKELDARAAELNARGDDLVKAAAALKANTEAAQKALLEREQAVAADEAALKVRRDALTQALAGVVK